MYKKIMLIMVNFFLWVNSAYAAFSRTEIALSSALDITPQHYQSLSPEIKEDLFSSINLMGTSVSAGFIISLLIMECTKGANVEDSSCKIINPMALLICLGAFWLGICMFKEIKEITKLNQG